MNESLPIPGIISLVVALQFAAFGWRINREISVGDKGEKTWLPLTDRVNFLSMFLTLTCCILLPLFLGRFSRLSMSVFGFSSVLIFWHPISMAAHYELLAGPGRRRYAKEIASGKAIDFEILPYAPRQERISVLASLIVALSLCLYLVFR